MQLSEYYQSLLIGQFRNKPKAISEIKLKADSYQFSKQTIDAVFDSFDLDSAVGDQLTKIGKLVGLRRAELPEAVAQNDDDYRFLVRAKVTVNQASAYIVNDVRTTLQDAVQFSTGGSGVVLNNRNMTLTLQVDQSISDERVYLLFDLGLLPSPQGVTYSSLIRAPSPFFGFLENPNAAGFGVGFFARNIARP